MNASCEGRGSGVIKGFPASYPEESRFLNLREQIAPLLAVDNVGLACVQLLAHQLKETPPALFSEENQMFLKEGGELGDVNVLTAGKFFGDYVCNLLPVARYDPALHEKDGLGDSLFAQRGQLVLDVADSQRPILYLNSFGDFPIYELTVQIGSIARARVRRVDVIAFDRRENLVPICDGAEQSNCDGLESQASAAGTKEHRNNILGGVQAYPVWHWIDDAHGCEAGKNFLERDSKQVINVFGMRLGIIDDLAQPVEAVLILLGRPMYRPNA